MAKTRFTLEDLNKKGFVMDENGTMVKSDSKPKPKAKSKSNQQLLPDYVKDSYQIFIPGNVPSSKNSRINFTEKDGQGNAKLTANGKFSQRSIKSDLSRKWEKKVKPVFEKNKDLFKELAGKENPVKVEMFFVRDSFRKWDFHNAIQIVADMMTACEWIEDDDVENLLIYPPMRYPYYWVDKENAGVFLRVKK